ncbi:bifunctional protein GlmU [Candidatus Phycosocius bacilliformis]|uniref:Bifunctional protein GlmU n=1 Tax=Candidatus Phycosocius bacilliformis TaxID=1445552 RepID=A0A2P2EBH3_9PROT|nr:bifunctional UDP-N-acetylglucosamine diphosphorylase/glucosamine-1-phosphate N-acetyltransferase GlmU [Candidatus Phycosocius bacilliformis]GBF58393.1 bifunctional protein GlmU [Candidatus Phycosocius bacilliformis]
MSRSRAAIILAAGHGTRMKSSLSKVLHPVGGRPMLDWTIALARGLGCEKIVVVVGAHNPDARARAEALLGPGTTALQDPPLGTAHAVRAAQAALAGFSGDAIVLYADTPLIGAATADHVFTTLAEGYAVSVLGFEAEDPGAYGRLIETPEGDLAAIVEAKEASPEQLTVRLCNSGVLAAPAPLLFELLAEVKNDNAKGEYYLTDVVALARARGHKAKAVPAQEAEVLGVNSRVELAVAEARFQAARRHQAMLEGVTLIAPETVHFSHDTQLAADVVVEPHVVFGPKVVVETGAVIRAFSHLEDCIIRRGALIGPYARIRPGSDIGENAHIGNFVETKKAKIGAGAKANHLTYLGDVTVGAKTNIGAGTVTCNYDGFDKYHTEIGANAFIGSDTMLVAPVSVGEGAMTGSGSVITKDVPAGALAVERSEQRNLDGWATKFRARKAAAKAAKASPPSGD